MNSLLIQRLSESATIPLRSTEGSAGLDVFASENIIVKPNFQEIVNTDVAIKCPAGTYARLTDRSSLTLKKIRVNGGVIDSDYTGPIKVVLYNYGNVEYEIMKGDRICQMIITPVSFPELKEVRKLPDTDRGTKGFGSTGRQ